MATSIRISKSKADEPVKLPITKPAFVNAKLAEWISECVKRMNEHKRYKAIDCGFDCPASKVYRETDEITVQECGKDADIEAELVSEISAYAASLETK